MMTISISNLRKQYREVAAVDGLSLEIPGGSVFGLLGPNGAGKTTTFKCMLGLARATERYRSVRRPAAGAGERTRRSRTFRSAASSTTG